MRILPVETRGLAHRSYLVVADGRAAVIDPQLEPDRYEAAALNAGGARITAVLETHRNEDFVSGAEALAERLGVPVLHGRGIPWGYGQEVGDGDVIEVGHAALRVVETPGHTPESVCFAAVDRSTGPDVVGVFTGDTLFVGDVGRTDLFADAAGDGDGPGHLYRSLHQKLMPLGEHVVVLPAHGAGSVCGQGLAERAVTTLGYERRNNPKLQLDPATFARVQREARHPRPAYFRHMEELNLEGASDPGPVPPVAPMSPEQVETSLGRGALAVDVRDPAAIAGAFLRGAVGIPLPVLGTYGGWLLPWDRDLVLICDSQDCAGAARRRLRRIGYERVVGWLQGGMLAWASSGRAYGHLPTLSGPDLGRLVADGGRQILDVRSPGEWASGHLPGALHLPLDQLPARMSAVPRRRPVVVVCGSGVRATIAATALAREGARDVAVSLGSMAACRAAGCPIVTEEEAEPA